MRFLKTALLSFFAIFLLSAIYIVVFDVTTPGQITVTAQEDNLSISESQNVTKQLSLYEDAQTQTLGWYRNLPIEDKQELIANMYARTDTNGTADDFYSMMGDMAYNKSQTVKFTDVWRWCVNEAELKPKRFKSHFNPMEERDLRDKAYYACQNLVKVNILAPFSAVFPNKYDVITHGHDKYTVIAFVDSQNQYGAMIRMNWNCDIKYKYGSWKGELEFTER